MRAPPRIRGGVATRSALLVAGLAFFAAGIVAYLESGLGLPPWDVLHQGIADQTPLSFGGASIVVSLAVVLVAWRLGARLGPATWANAVLVGTFIVALTSIESVDRLSSAPLPARAGVLAAGVALIGVGSGLYLGASFGAGPRDSLMVVGVQRTLYRVSVVRTVLEVTALAVGVLLGGTVGVGTAIFALSAGPSVEASFWLLDRSGLTER